MTVLPRAMLLGVCLLGAGMLAASAEAGERFRKRQVDDRIQNTACELGPDGHLYVVSMNYHGRTRGAQLTRYLLDSHGRPLGEKEVVHSWKDEAKAQPIGLAFDPAGTPQLPVAWIALGESLQGHSGWSDPWAGRVYRAELPAAGSVGKADFELKITNLPHAFHTVNDICFGPDEKLYICCGSTTTSGWEPHMSEQLLSGAVLQADVKSIRGTLDVKTGGGGTYNPFAPDAPVKLFSTAIRQPYDCAWHPNGRLYACTNQNDVNGQTGSGGGVPDVKNVKPPEFLAILQRGKTYGFPNAARGEFVLMGGNPTASDDGWTEVESYPPGVTPPDTFDPSLLHRIDDIDGGSADGILTYHASGALQDRLVCCFYSADKIYTFAVGDDGHVRGRDPLRDHAGEPMSIKHPLDICQHPTSGHLYVAAYGRQDKGEGGAVYFLERQSQPATPAFGTQPIALVGQLSSGDTEWSDTVSVFEADNAEKHSCASTDADWLEVRGSTPAGDADTAFRVRARGPLPPGTHYGSVEIRDGHGHHRKVGVQVYVPDQDREQWFAVSAGNSRDITPKRLPVELPLEGTLMSAREAGKTELRWEVVSGPAAGVRITDPRSATTRATFERPGRYRLQLAAERNGRSRQQTATFVIDQPGNAAPQIDVRASAEKAGPGDSIRLTAHATDDGRPKSIGKLSYRWSREGTGKGVVEFSDPDGPTTTARFPRAGPYRLRCTVSDGVRQAHEEMVIQVGG